MPVPHKDISGLTFGRLTVLERAAKRGPGTNRTSFWVCRCECGATKEVRSDKLKDGTTVSCGCLNRENAKRIFTTHGMHRTPEYQAWVNMRQRCSDPKTKHYKNYGGRGIKVHPEWGRSFEAFFAEVGPRPGKGYELDRANNDGNYEPGNVRWVTKAENNANRRCTKEKRDV